MEIWESMRAAPLRDVVLCMGAAWALAAVALARFVLSWRRRAAREEPVLRCIRELRWDGSWPTEAYRDRLAERLHAQLGVGPRRSARGRIDLSFDYQGTTWFIAIRDRFQSTQRTLIERDVADLFVACAARPVESPTVAVVVGVPSGAPYDNPQLRALRAALVRRSARPPSSHLNLEVVAVPAT